MSGDKKVVKRKWTFWRSYSVLLTLLLLVSLALVSASADDFSYRYGQEYYRFVDGVLQEYRPTINRWQNASGGLLAVLNDDVKVAAAGGGLTLAELQQALQDYVGKRVSTYQFPSGNGTSVNVTVSDLYDAIAKNATYSTMPFYDRRASELTLKGDGTVVGSGPAALTELTRDGFAGLGTLSTQLHKDLVGTGSFSGRFLQADGGYGSISSDNLLELLGKVTSFLSFNQNLSYKQATQGFKDMKSLLGGADNNLYPSADYQELVGQGVGAVNQDWRVALWHSDGEGYESFESSGLLALTAFLGSSMQNDLAKLRYVLASDKDIEMAEKQEPVKDAVGDNFTGDSPAAVKPSDVGDMAGISGDLQDAFNTGANASDVIGALNSSDNWLFWSQAVANDLNQVPSAASDELEDDFIHFYDPSAVDEYLSGGGQS